MTLTPSRTFGLAALLLTPAVHAEAPPAWGLCAPLPAPPAGVAAAPAEAGPVRIDADRARSRAEGVTSFEGNVTLLREGRRLDAQRLDYDQAEDVAQARGDVRLDTPRLSLQGDRGRFRLGEETGFIENARFLFRDYHAFGGAERVELAGRDRAELDGARYTTCGFEDPDWELRAERVELDRETGVGKAYHTSLWFKDVPFFYTPYISYPLDGRKTGFLVPSYGSSERGGAELTVPYYWNIAPDRDATTTLRYFEERGPMLMGEFRYLNPTGRGRVNLDVLPDDDVYADDRGLVHLEHVAYPDPHWFSRVDYTHVSDDDYFNDLDNTLGRVSTTHLAQFAETVYRGRGWSISGRVEAYQSLVENDPYERLPEVRFQAATPLRPGELRYGVDAELVRFDHSDPVVTGNRLDLTPHAALPMEGAAWFVRPRVSLRHTRYDLTDADYDDDPDRTVPVASLDGGLFFERDLELGDHALVQTLEPRLFYLYVPYEDQSELPDFDTSRYTFGFDQLFRENRFAGRDRVGDANQLSLAVTSRFLDGANGVEYLRGSLGRVLYFDDREVTLDGAPETDSDSNLVGELAGSPLPGLSLRATAEYDPDKRDTIQALYRIHFQRDAKRFVSAAYRYRKPDQAQYDLAVRWPLTPNWHFVGRWYYDIEEESFIETAAGVEYDSCCWAVRAVVRDRPYEDAAGEWQEERSYLLTFTLKGLTSLGSPLEDELRTGLVGYH